MPKPWRRGTRQRGDVAATDLTAGPAFVAPCEPVLVRAPPSGPEWLHELKLDGYRMVLVIDRGVARIHTKRGLDWTNLADAGDRSGSLGAEAPLGRDRRRSHNERRERRSRLLRPARGARQGRRARRDLDGLRPYVSERRGCEAEPSCRTPQYAPERLAPRRNCASRTRLEAMGQLRFEPRARSGWRGSSRSVAARLTAQANRMRGERRNAPRPRISRCSATTVKGARCVSPGSTRASWWGAVRRDRA